VRITCLTNAEALRHSQAIEPDNEGMLLSRIEGKDLVLEAKGAPLTVLRTLDDALACLRALEGAANSKQADEDRPRP
jgi:hypothetical protein